MCNEVSSTKPLVESEPLEMVPIVEPPASKRERLGTACGRKLADLFYRSEVRRIAQGIREALNHNIGTLDDYKAVCEAALDAVKVFAVPDPATTTTHFGVAGAMLAGMKNACGGYVACQDAAAVVIAEIEGATTGLAEIRKGRAEVEAVIGRLDPKSRGIIGALLLLGELESNAAGGPDWPQRLLFDVLGDVEQTEAAFNACPDDADVSVMRRFFNLAWQVAVIVEPNEYRNTEDSDESEGADDAIAENATAEEDDSAPE